jgi:hypothetical protein
MAVKKNPSKKTSDVGSGGQGKPNILVIWGDDIGIANLQRFRLEFSGSMGHNPRL